MATYTENYNLKKPDLSDIANIGDINDNMDIIDEEMSKLIDSVPTMSGASASTDGESGVVPQPVAGDNAKYLRGDATYSVPGVMTINGRTPDPVTGDITVIEGGGSGSYGSYRLDATIPVSAWSGSGPYTTTITNEYIKSTMDGSETWLDNEAAMLGETTFTTRDGSLLVSTTVKPTAQWVLHVSLALNGADVLADMSASIANVADGLAILATGDTHAQIAKNQFVYVRNHGTANGFSGTAVLADGLYVANAAINANGSLTTSNLAADGAGGLNALKADYDALSSKINSKNLVNYDLPMETKNLNLTLENMGLRQYDFSATGTPTANGGVVFTMLCANNQGAQIAKPNNQSFLNVRWLNNGTWSAWMRFSVTAQS